MGSWKDRTGDVINGWTFIGGYERIGNKSYWVVRCRCGFEAKRETSDIVRGQSKSCGSCGYNKKTDHYNSPTYRSWHGMKQRCLNKNNKRYSDYGGRGIDVCDDWLEFESFLKDMGVRPSENHSLDRIDNNKGYSKENCKWSNRYEQTANQRVSKNNKLGVRGVCFNKSKNKFSAQMMFKGKMVLKKHFSTMEEAIEARKAAEEYYYKQL